MASWTQSPPERDGWYWVRGPYSEFVLHVEERGGVLCVPQAVGDPVESLTHLVWGPRVPSPDELEAMEDVIKAARGHRNDYAAGFLDEQIEALDKIREGKP